ncbi:MAG: sialate O-acetylesterase, partial [Prolixibacteraceae bacterium]|nr:sialate O-acetylesterase [Prolixibacteraceae bacterium]
MKRNLTAFLTITFFLILSQINAEVKLPAIFGDNMVLQQQSDAAIWGTSAANKTVKVTTSWDKKSYSTKADSEGNWKLKVKTPSAGGPFSITISDGKTLKLSNVLIGEVWVCSGQSNMAMSVDRAYDPDLEILTAKYPNIRLISVPQVGTQEPQNDFKGEWAAATPETVGSFSA